MEKIYISAEFRRGDEKTCKNTRVTNDDGDATHFGREICVDGILHIGAHSAAGTKGDSQRHETREHAI